MKFISALLITASISFLGALVLPWWVIAVSGFVVAFVIIQHPFKAFLAGFIAGFLAWGIHAFVIDQANQHVMATRVAGVFSLGGPYMMILVTGLTGAIVTGFAALSASLLKARMAAKQ
ncbi:MAG: hypothetical protein EOO02_01495 [Chitinophagaceae bacterium]|nr:MAG: hypothetical protein EOO02_01495 [Chitinophagaceae bacterium]